MRVPIYILKLGLVLGLTGGCLVAQPVATTNANDRTETNITKVTVAFLQQLHYSQHPFDQEIANKFLDRYLDTLDGLHLYFLQSDLKEFETLRTNLHVVTMRGDTTPCRVIFERFLQRVDQRHAFVTNLIATSKFEFSGQDRYVFDRRKLPAPKDMAEAKELWRQELRWSYLGEKLQAPDIKFAGPAAVESNGEVTIRFTKDKEHPLAFDVLPKTFYNAAGKEIGTLNVQSESNAIVRIKVNKGAGLVKFDEKIYSKEGVEIGKTGCRWQTNEIPVPEVATADSPEAPAVATNTPSAPQMTNEYVGVVQLNQKNLSEITKTLVNRYTRLAKNFKDLDRDDVFELYMTCLAHAYDPHSDYMGHSQSESFSIQIKLSLFGIGAVLRSDDEGYCKIDSLTEGPASKSGKIKPGDRIVAVAQGKKEPVDVVGMKLSKVVDQIRGPKGTEVRLTMIPAGSADSSARRVVSLIRDEIKLDDQAAKAKIFEVPSKNGGSQRLGVIDLPAFYGNSDGKASRVSTTMDVARLIRRLKKENVSGIILDLRRNGGGLLEEAITLTGLFITKGPVVQTKEFTGEVSTDSDPDSSILYDGPLIVLTSRFSASASEILAGALQDYGRAVIVGDKATYGKGTVQTVQSLTNFFNQRKLEYAYDPGTLKLTIRKFYRAGGASTQLAGVVPDMELPSLFSHLDVGESSMEYALPWDVVPSADPQNMNQVKPFLRELQTRSSQRLAKDKDFAYVQEDIEQYKKTQADKSVSLNEAARIAEKKENEARQEARKKERLARAKSDEKVYELTMKNVELAELQPPVVKTNGTSAMHIEIPELSDEEPVVDAKVPDATLEETKRILEDYIAVFNKRPAVTAK